MKAEIIAIGDELLIGQTIDTNSAWLGEQLSLHGVRLNKITTISDVPTEITDAVNSAFSRVNLVLVTGGLGPTQDDVTKETLTSYFDTELVMHPEVLSEIEEYFTSRGRKMLEVNRKQAELPKSAHILKNNYGTAMGMWFEKNEKVLISLPGVPYEMKGIMEEYGFQKISERFNTTPVIHKTILTQGIGESFIADQITDLETSLRNEGFFLAYLPSPGMVRLRISGFANAKGAEELEKRMERYIVELKRRFPKYIYGMGTETLSEVVGKLLRERNYTLSAAESCTGGYLSHLITSTPGSGDYFVGSVVSYALEAKVKMLEVSPDAIELYTAVSDEVVREMANGAKKKFNSHYAIATSGYAGPDGGDDKNPVGTIWIAIAGPKKTVAKRYFFVKNRNRNITISVLTALNWLRNKILSGELE